MSGDKHNLHQPPLEFIEEVDERSRPTGVEYEDPQQEGAPAKPYDPELIRVDPKTFSLRQILDMIDEGDLQLAPDFQRLRVWTPLQKSRLIESVLLRIPLPAFYFSSDKSGGLQVVDGLQRLSTIHDFVRGGPSKDAYFPLIGVEYLQDQCEGKTFKELDSAMWSRRINNTQIVAHVIDPQTPYRVKFDIFRRINTGGSPLNAQEIRHCLSLEKSRTFLKKLTAKESFQVATNYALHDHVRMVDREVVLRFCGFRHIPGLGTYADFPTMDEFLNNATQHLDKASDNELQLLEGQFDRAMMNAHQLFGKHAFRKWPLDDDRLCPFNRALFDVLSVLLADFEWQNLQSSANSIIAQIRDLMTDDIEFIDSISSSTGDPAKVRKRFGSINAILPAVKR